MFCGYCGTHLSYWTEEPAAEADYLSVTLGSLVSDDIRALQDLELLPEDVEPQDVGAHSETDRAADTRQVARQQVSEEPMVRRSQRQGTLGDIDWFEEMINGSRLGRTQQKRRGMGVSADGTTTVQWEISEYREGEDEFSASATTAGTGKRKFEDVTGDDVNMKG